MRKVLVKNLKGNEILAKTLYSNLDTELMIKGTIVRKDYAQRLSELNIEYIYIEDEISQGILEEEITENQIKNQCQKIVAETMDRYAYSGNSEFEKLKEVATNIIEDMLNEPEVMFNISGVRQKSEEIYAHSLNVCALSVLLALRLNLPSKKISDIAMGSILHDIGFMNVPIEKIGKNNLNEYTEAEKKAIHMHVIYGYSLVENEKWINSAAKDIILSHHELIDGSGYPMHLKANKIKIGTKIVSVCDSFDNLVYGNFVKKLKVHEAMETIVAYGGKKFDLDIIKVFNESVAAYPIGTIVKTSENQTGIVLKQNHRCPTRPIVRILKDKNDIPIKDWVEKDLTKKLTLFITETLEDY
ncbi:MAG: HD domain-containing protein [Acetivibrio sp.]